MRSLLNAKLFCCEGRIVGDMSNDQVDRRGIQEDWELLVSFLPTNWQDLAAATGDIERPTQEAVRGHLLRMPLLHLGCGQPHRPPALDLLEEEPPFQTGGAAR